MALQIGSHFRIILNQTYNGQQVINVMHYTWDSGAVAADPPGIAQAWWDDIKASIRPAVVSPLTFDSVELYDADDPAGEYGAYTIPTGERAGTGAATGESPFVAYALRLGVANRLTKPGYMRLCGVDDNSVGYFGEITAAQLVKLNTLATDLLDGFGFGALEVGQASMSVYGAPHAASTRFPARVDPVFNPVTAITPASYVTTQNSRKVGRGA